MSKDKSWWGRMKKEVLNPEVTIEQSETDKAIEVLKQEREQRAKRCMEKVNAALAEDNCSLISLGQWVGQQIKTEVQVVAN